MGLTTSILDQIHMTRSAIGANMSIARFIAVTFNAATPVITITKFAIRTFGAGAALFRCLCNNDLFFETTKNLGNGTSQSTMSRANNGEE